MAVRGRSKQTAQQRMPPSLCSNLSDLPGVLSPALKRFLAGPSGSAKHSSLVDSANSDPDTELPVSSAIFCLLWGCRLFWSRRTEPAVLFASHFRRPMESRKADHVAMASQWSTRQCCATSFLLRRLPARGAGRVRVPSVGVRMP